PGRADVDRDQVQAALDVVETKIVDADDLAAVDVDDLLVLQILVEQQLVGALTELVDIDDVRRELRAGRVDRGHVRPGQEDAPAPGRDDQAGDGRIAIADRDDEVRDLADRLSLAIERRLSDRLAQVEHRDSTARGTKGAASVVQGTPRR